MVKNKVRVLSNKEYIKLLVQTIVTAIKLTPVTIVLQIIGSVIQAVLPISVAFFAGLTTTALADAFSGVKDAGGQAIFYVVITAILGVVQIIWRGLESYLSTIRMYRVEVAISDKMYEHFLNLEFWRYDDKKTADTFEKAQRFSRIIPSIFERVMGVGTLLATAIFSITALFFVNWWLGVLILIAIVPDIMIQFKISRFVTSHWGKNILARRSRYMIEDQFAKYSSMAELRLYGLARHLLDLRIKYRNQDEKQRIEYERKYQTKRLTADIIQAVAEVMALIWITLQIIGRSQPIGQFVYVQQVVSRALSGAKGIVGSLSSMGEDIANMSDYQIFMNLPEQKSESVILKNVPQKIEVNNLSFNYPNNSQKVLHNISLNIASGQKVAIVGENGAGKSTLLKLILGLYKPSIGDLSIDGLLLKDIDTSSWHKYIGVLQQDFIHYEFASAKENILFGDVSKPVNQDQLQKALENSESKTFVNKLPKGVNTYVDTWMEDDEGDNGVALSGGQWQRLALARNFYRNSPIVILDEPTSAIDALAESRIFKRLFNDKSKTMIIVSHRYTTIQRADIIYMMKDGKIVEEGTASELVAKRGEFYKMFESQL